MEEPVGNQQETTQSSCAKNNSVLKPKPDLEFIGDVAALGGETAKKCFQCATCSATCPISPDCNPFPRKEMIWASWGMKDQLLKDPDVWLCHQCNDCSAICPREANPGDILASIRKYIYQNNASPAFLGTIVSQPKFLPLLIGIPALLMAIVVGAFGNFMPEGEIIFKNFLPHPFPLDFLFSFFAFFAAGVSAVSGLKFWNSLKEGPRPPVPDAKGFIPGLIKAIQELVLHSQFKECDKANPRYLSHLLTFYGFIALFATTTFVFLGLYLLGWETPLGLMHPVKILGNLGALAFLVGTGLMLVQRLTDSEKSGASTYNDWLFIGIMFGLALSGILTELIRLANIPVLAYSMYFIHLVLILSMMAYFPFSKFAHLLYRTLAITYYYGYAVSDEAEKSDTSVQTETQADAA